MELYKKKYKEYSDPTYEPEYLYLIHGLLPVKLAKTDKLYYRDPLPEEIKYGTFTPDPEVYDPTTGDPTTKTEETVYVKSFKGLTLDQLEVPKEKQYFYKYVTLLQSRRKKAEDLEREYPHITWDGETIFP